MAGPGSPLSFPVHHLFLCALQEVDVKTQPPAFSPNQQTLTRPSDEPQRQSRIRTGDSGMLSKVSQRWLSERMTPKWPAGAPAPHRSQIQQTYSSRMLRVWAATKLKPYTRTCKRPSPVSPRWNAEPVSVDPGTADKTADLHTRAHEEHRTYKCRESLTNARRTYKCNHGLTNAIPLTLTGSHDAGCQRAPHPRVTAAFRLRTVVCIHLTRSGQAI